MKKNLLAQIHHFFFDLDGTLIDSNALHAEAFCAVLREEFPDALESFNYETLKGLTTRHAFEYLGITSTDQLDRCAQNKQRFYRDAVESGKLPIMPGAKELLETLIANNRSCSIATSASKRSATLALTAGDLIKFFTNIVTADDVARGKPSPDPYLKCLKLHQCNASEAIAIEDASYGILSAQTAHLKVIGVHNPEIANSADYYFPNLMALKKAFMISLTEENNS